MAAAWKLLLCPNNLPGAQMAADRSVAGKEAAVGRDVPSSAAPPTNGGWAKDLKAAGAAGTAVAALLDFSPQALKTLALVL